MVRAALIALAACAFLEVANAESRLLSLLSPELRRNESEIQKTRSALSELGRPVTGQTVQEIGYLHSKIQTPPGGRWVQVDLQKEFPIDLIALIPVQTDWDVQSGMKRFPKRFRVDISQDASFSQSTAIETHADSDFPNPGIAPVTFETQGQVARYVRVTVYSPAEFALAELMVISGNRNVAIRCPVTSTDAVATPPRWYIDNLVDGKTPLGPPILQTPAPADGIYAGPPENKSPTFFQLELDAEYSIDEVRLHPVHTRESNDLPGYAFPSRFKLEASLEPTFADPTLLYWGGRGSMEFAKPGNNPVTIPVQGVKAKYIRFVLVAPSAFIHAGRFGLSEMEVYSGNENVARKATVTATVDPSPKTGTRPKTLLNDGFASFGKIIELPEWLRRGTQQRELEQQLSALLQVNSVLTEQASQHAWRLAGALAILGMSAAFFFLQRSRKQRLAELDSFRKQLARDLHDEVGSNLAAIGVISEVASKGANVGPEYWERVKDIARETSDAMRETLWLVGGREETGINIVDHLKLVASRMLPDCEVQWVCEVETFPSSWNADDRRQLFLFFKEAITNVARHSQAKHVRLTLQIPPSGELYAEISDDGRGFASDSKTGGIGLYSIKERARQMGGAAQIQSTPGSGTRISLRVKSKV